MQSNKKVAEEIDVIRSAARFHVATFIIHRRGECAEFGVVHRQVVGAVSSPTRLKHWVTRDSELQYL